GREVVQGVRVDQVDVAAGGEREHEAQVGVVALHPAGLGHRHVRERGLGELQLLGPEVLDPRDRLRAAGGEDAHLVPAVDQPVYEVPGQRLQAAGEGLADRVAGVGDDEDV